MIRSYVEKSFGGFYILLKVYEKKSKNRDFLKNQSEQEITNGAVNFAKNATKLTR